MVLDAEFHGRAWLNVSVELAPCEHVSNLPSGSCRFVRSLQQAADAWGS